MPHETLFKFYGKMSGLSDLLLQRMDTLLPRLQYTQLIFQEISLCPQAFQYGLRCAPLRTNIFLLKILKELEQT